MIIHPIRELTAAHHGRVVLINIREWAHCIGLMGRRWAPDESRETRGAGPEDVHWIVWSGFTHFAMVDDIETEERRIMLEEHPDGLTASEQEMLTAKYGLPQEQKP